MNNTNEEILKQIESDIWDRNFIFENYKPLGETIDKTGLNQHEKRLANYQQFFTPYPAVRFITRALNLDQVENAIVLDNSCGMGRMFRYLHPSTRIVGIELEENAYRVAKALFPNANIIHDNLINHVLPNRSVDASLINPPFSIRLEKRDSGLYNAQWGVLGPRSSVESHIAALEIAIRASRFYVAAVLPTTFFKNETTRTFEKWIKERAKEVLRIDLPADAHAGANWPTTLVIYDTQPYHYSSEETPHWTVNTLAELEDLLVRWRSTDYYNRFVRELNDEINRYSLPDLHLQPQPPVEIPPMVTPKLPLTASNSKVNICVNPTNSQLHLKTYDLLTALKVQEYKDDFGKRYNNASKTWVSEWWIKARRPEAFYNLPEVKEIEKKLQLTCNEVQLDSQIAHLTRKHIRWLKQQLTPFEQWIQKEDGTWELKFKDEGVCAKYPQLYKQQAKELERIMQEHPYLTLWDWQKHDIIRLSMKQHAIMAWDMGLGKTRAIIASALLARCKHNLIITESKLIGQFAGELKQFGCDFKIINKYSDTKRLKQFNLIAYSKIWRKATRGKTFAKALKKQCQFIALDEAHNIKANDSKRALACRSMHPKHWLLASGTPIANYPRNIFSLLVCAFGDGTELFPYGYYTPYIGGIYDCTSGTRQFREDFVTISAYISHQFEHTLDKGKRMREFPIIKDIDKWHRMLAPMMIRRCRDEPEVMQAVKIPEPEIKEVWIKPCDEHIRYYKLWLDEFAEWFMEQMKAEIEGHKFDTIALLVQIGKLQFVSTVPQSAKIKSDSRIEYNWNGNLTTKQQRIIELATQHIHQGQKVIVYSERPELQNLLAKEFRKRGIKALVFTGEQSISKRDEILQDFRVNGMPLLLATTTVGGVGLNLPEARVIIFADQNWSPKIEEQAIARVCRPQQQNKPLVYKLYNSGFIDEYIKQMQDAKRDGIDEGIDWQNHNFDPSQWLSFRDVSYKYLQEQGYL